jgi:hypothetical protein
MPSQALLHTLRRGDVRCSEDRDIKRLPVGDGVVTVGGD